MSDTTASLRRKIASAGDLQSVVRTMKALAASNIGQYERSVLALADYTRSVELGLGACFRAGATRGRSARRSTPAKGRAIDAVVFGSDEGLVGRFNDVVAERAIRTLATHTGEVRFWAVGERVSERLADAGVAMAGRFAVPRAAGAITPLFGQILVVREQRRGDASDASDDELHLFYNRPAAGAAYATVGQRLLPLDDAWRSDLARRPWPEAMLPEVLGDSVAALRAFVREFLFIALFRACAESLASENASRLEAMQRADKNIDELLESLHGSFHRLRQSDIDEELFDVIAGYEAMSGDVA
ncbi:MAG: F0F1 ATP synthase subunit gamma [Burkholderiaceae bacterium]